MYLKLSFIYLYSLIHIIFAEIVRDLVCEDETLELTCPNGFVLDIRNAMYGRRNLLYCTMVGSKVNDCSATTALSVVRSRCNRRETCSIPAHNNIFGDPCAGTAKYLEVTYECKKVDIITKYACENDVVHLKCREEDSYIYIANVLYGRTNPAVCSVFLDRQVVSNKCKASNALSIVQAKCDHLRECKIKASNEVFGDPCSGTFKYIEVDFQCLYRDD
ncbi:hypothetical protein O3M35_001183 [Rhynocoris fuscipes]|uniref:SUEL-type lectin domain-containing protein n=1 Tax=Rhynocoris fuscipes TaxID=488301 RepID=A0AAW1DRC4_9HEMI